MARILAAMSGGVDSSVAAALLREQGHDVIGAYMKNWINEEEIVGSCPWEEDIEDAQGVAEKLGIEFRIVNLIREYRDRVVRYLLDGYEAGVTPNPDVMCNREMKFGVFLEYARQEGFDAVATGHYARIADNPEGTRAILRGRDRAKDQSYFLAMLRQDQVRGAAFPIGDMGKAEVRKRAADFRLDVAGKKDSQGICFIGQVRMSDFLRAFIDDRPGGVVTVDGERVGEHRGLHLYTLGQRRGLGVPSPHFRQAYVVVAKRPESNELVVGFDEPDTPGLYASRCRLASLSFIGKAPAEGAALLAQPRYRTRAAPAVIRLRDGGEAELVFDDPQRALTPGQICALYDGDRLLGGGIFAEIEHDGAASTAAVTAAAR